MAKLTKLLTFSLFAAAFHTAVAQTERFPMQDGVVKGLIEPNYELSDGTPYFTPKWEPGEVTLANGKTYKGVKLRYDMVADEVYYKQDEGTAMRFAVDVKSFKFYGLDGMPEAVFVTDMPQSDGSKPNSFFQLLADGKMQLLKRVSKSVEKGQAYSNSTYTLRENTYYYLRPAGGSLIKLKKDKKWLVSQFGDKGAQVERYIASNNVDVKTDQGLAAAVDYYNSL